MTTYALYGLAGADGTLAYIKKLEEYFGCGVTSGHFAVTNKPWPGLMGRKLNTKETKCILTVVYVGGHFAVTNKAWPGLMGCWLKTQNSIKYLDCGVRKGQLCDQ